MRIDHLHIENFKKFSKQDFHFHPHFTLLAGENGSGKTSILDALAVAAGIWLIECPDSGLYNSQRPIYRSEVRLEPNVVGDRVQFKEVRPTRVTAGGILSGNDHAVWRSAINERTDATNEINPPKLITDVYSRDRRGEKVLFPVLAYYGASRAWLPSKKHDSGDEPMPINRRWAAFYDCFKGQIHLHRLAEWFLGETVAAGNRGGRMRPGFEAVKQAVLRCVPEADGLWYDHDLKQIVLSISGGAQPLDNLSAGQRMMLALVADLAIKAVTQNAFLLPPDSLGPEDEPLPKVLRETPGLVLIDELDVHLHPKWQRRVATDLKETFPSIQFVCTSHSPQVIGELKPEEVRLLDETVSTPDRSFGIDSSRILEELMDAKPRNESVEALLRKLSGFVDREDFEAARGLLPELEAKLGPDDPEITRARTLMTFLESKA